MSQTVWPVLWDLLYSRPDLALLRLWETEKQPPLSKKHNPLSPFSLLGLLLGLCVLHGFFDFDRARRPGKDLVVFFLSFFLSFFFFLRLGKKEKEKERSSPGDLAR